MDQELQHFLISGTEGEALEVIQGAEGEPGWKPWRRLAALYDPPSAGRSLDDSRQIFSPWKAVKIDDLSHTIQSWEILEQRDRERTGNQLPEDMRLRAPHWKKDLTAQQNVFPDYAQMKAHIVTVINSRTRGLAQWWWEIWVTKTATIMPVVTDLGQVTMENWTAWKSGTARRFSLNLVMIQAKAKEEGRVKLTESFRCGRIGHIRADCRAKPHINGRVPNFAPKRKSVGNCKDEETVTSQNVPLETIDLGSSEVLPDHGKEVGCWWVHMWNRRNDAITVNWFLVEEDRDVSLEDHWDEEYPFLDYLDGKHEQFDALQQMDLWARNAPKSEPDVKGCLSVNFPVCSLCQKLVVYQRLPIKAPQYDISSEGEDRLSDNSNDGRVVAWRGGPDRSHNWQHDCRQQTSCNRWSEVGTEKSQLTSVKRKRFWIRTIGQMVNVKPSRGSVKGQRYFGPWRWKDRQSGRLDSKSSHRTTRWGWHLEPSDILRSQGPQALACSVGSDWQR